MWVLIRETYDGEKLVHYYLIGYGSDREIMESVAFHKGSTLQYKGNLESRYYADGNQVYVVRYCPKHPGKLT